MSEDRYGEKQPEGVMREEEISEEQVIANERLETAPPFEEHVLHRPIRDLPDLHPVVAVERHEPLRAAIERMNDELVEGVVVVEQGKVVGVLSAFDICKTLLDGRVDIDQTPVEALMLPRPECLHLNHDVAFALHQMHVAHAPIIPLVDAQGHTLGVVSSLDVIGSLAEMYPQEVLNLPPSPENEFPTQVEGA
jgi:CBS domain-containing protein